MKALSLSVADILDATQGELLAGDPKKQFSGVSIDSRQINANDLFVAIKGEHHDGHTFIEEVLNKGIKGVVVQQDSYHRLQIKPQPDQICIVVSDTVAALGKIAHFHRQLFNILVVAITGSNGKTSTKEMTASALEQKYRVLATAGNFNNEIGVPLTLFRLNDTHQMAVLELGMNHPGEIYRLGTICVPDIGVITNIGHSHLEGLGSIEAVKNAKAELLDTLAPDGKAVLNADDPNVMDLAAKTPKEVITYGEASHAMVRADGVRLENDAICFELKMPNGRIDIRLHVAGKFMVTNALAAAAVGHVCGLSSNDIKIGLEAFIPVKGRLTILHSPAGVNIIDDTYNANPSSMKAAVSTLVQLRQGERKIGCFGDMLELGDFSERLHEEIGEEIGRANLSRLFLTGVFAENVAKGAAAGGMAPDDIFIGTQEDILAALKTYLTSGDWILVKGSRSTHMEKIVDRLIQTEGKA